MKAVREQIRDTGQVGGSNEFPKVEADIAEKCGCGRERGHKGFLVCSLRHAAPIAPAAVADTKHVIADKDCLPQHFEDAKDQHIANLESELQIARDLIQKQREQLKQELAQIEVMQREMTRTDHESSAKTDRIAELQRQLSAANLGSAMQHERYGSY